VVTNANGQWSRRYYCWGRLAVVAPRVRPATKQRPQDIAAVRLAHARKKIGEATRRMARLATSLRMWERRAAYYAKRASMTDAEVMAEREKATAAKGARADARKRRAITLGGL
jgi:hypothetical protein